MEKDKENLGQMEIEVQQQKVQLQKLITEVILNSFASRVPAHVTILMHIVLQPRTQAFGGEGRENRPGYKANHTDNGIDLY